MKVRRPKKFILTNTISEKCIADIKSDNLSPYVWISSCPYIHKHDGEGLTKEKQIHKEGEGYHGDGAEEKHHDKIGRLSPKTALFKHPKNM